MKKILIGLLGSALFAFPVSALESRTFTSADGSKSFKGVLEDYDAKAGIVNVKQEGRRSPLKFKLSLLSEADQEYVELEGPALAASKAVRLDFEIWKDKRVTAKSKDAKTVTTPAGYEIEVRNWTEHNVSDIEIRYTIFHRKDAENGPSSIAQTKGSFQISTLFAKSSELIRTDAVNLERYIRQGSGAC